MELNKLIVACAAVVVVSSFGIAQDVYGLFFALDGTNGSVGFVGNAAKPDFGYTGPVDKDRKWHGIGKYKFGNGVVQRALYVHGNYLGWLPDEDLEFHEIRNSKPGMVYTQIPKLLHSWNGPVNQMRQPHGIGSCLYRSCLYRSNPSVPLRMLLIDGCIEGRLWAVPIEPKDEPKDEPKGGGKPRPSNIEYMTRENPVAVMANVRAIAIPSGQLVAPQSQSQPQLVAPQSQSQPQLSAAMASK